MMKNSEGNSVERGTNGLEGFVREVLFLAPKDQVRFASMWVRGVREDRSLLLKIYFIVARGVNPATGLESWMESRLKKNMSLTPRRLAYECRYYKRVRREMTPYLLHLACRVKKKMLARQKKVLKDKAPDNGEGGKEL